MLDIALLENERLWIETLHHWETQTAIHLLVSKLWNCFLKENYIIFGYWIYSKHRITLIYVTCSHLKIFLIYKKLCFYFESLTVSIICNLRILNNDHFRIHILKCMHVYLNLDFIQISPPQYSSGLRFSRLTEVL
jgi:hypothetical protein